MPIFIEREQLYRLLQRELPEAVYPDGAPSGFYSTADMDSVAKALASSYESLERIYDNYFPQHADENLEKWEFALFGLPGDMSLGLAERRERVIAKLRAQRGLTVAEMIDVVKEIIGEDKEVEIAEWNCMTGGWSLDESQLDIETVLNAYHLLDATGDLAGCSDGSDFGIDPEVYKEMRAQAYTYEVRIYNYTLTSDERTAIDEALTKAEPARSDHEITDGLTDADKLDGDT